MGLLTGIFECVAAFLAGFFGHVAAHDFCEATPMISRKLIQFAVSRLPGSIRERYAAEWAADLYDQPGAMAKLLWAARCVWSVHQLRRVEREERIRQTAVEFALPTGEVMICDVATWYLIKSIMAVRISKIGQLLLNLPSPLDNIPLAGVLLPALIRRRRYGAPDDDKAMRVVMSWFSEDQKPVSVVVTVNGKKTHEPVNIAELAKRFGINKTT